MEEKDKAFTGDLISDCGDSNDLRGEILRVLENLYVSDGIYSNIGLDNNYFYLLGYISIYQRTFFPSYLGEIIIATNPFKDIPALSTKEVFREYRKIPDQISIRKNPSFKLSPHVWTVTRNAILYTLNGSSFLQVLSNLHSKI
jgi:hypothetical protein